MSDSPAWRPDAATLHPFFQARIAEADRPDGFDTQAFLAPAGAWAAADEIAITQRWIDVAGGAIPVRLYRHRDADQADRPAVLWLHGGGFVGGSLDWGEAHGLAAELCRRTGALVASVGYRLAGPTRHYPVLLDDVDAAWSWLALQAPLLGADGPRLIGGASAGANLAAANTLRLRDEGARLPDGLLLAYGVFHRPLPAPSPELAQLMHALPAALRFADLSGDAVYGAYLPLGAPGRYVAPGSLDLAGLPPVAMLSCEFDDLRASSDAFAEQLEAAGVPLSRRLARGMLHGHLNWFPAAALPEVSESIDFFAAAVHATVSQPSLSQPSTTALSLTDTKE